MRTDRRQTRGRRGRRRRAARERLAAALPEAPLFALAYGLAIGATVTLDIWLRAEAMGSRVREVVALFVVAGLASGFLAHLTTALLAGHRGPRVRAATVFLALAFFQLTLTGFGHGVVLRHYFAAQHDDPFTVLWFFQQIFTFAGAGYVFLVTGARLLLPFGLFVMIAAALLELRRATRPVPAAAGAPEPATGR